MLSRCQACCIACPEEDVRRKVPNVCLSLCSDAAVREHDPVGGFPAEEELDRHTLDPSTGSRRPLFGARATATEVGGRGLGAAVQPPLRPQQEAAGPQQRGWQLGLSSPSRAPTTEAGRRGERRGPSKGGAAAQGREAGSTGSPMHRHASRIQHFWRRRTSRLQTTSRTPSKVSSAAPQEVLGSRSSSRRSTGTSGQAPDAAASLIQRLWRRKNPRASLDAWVVFEGRRHVGDDLEGSGEPATEAEAKERAQSRSACMGFTLDVSRVPPVAWYHSRVSPSDCVANGGANRGNARLRLFVHSRRFAGLYRVLPGEEPRSSPHTWRPSSADGAASVDSVALSLSIPAAPASRSPLSDWGLASGLLPSEGEPSTFQEAVNRAAAKIQSMWRQKSKDERGLALDSNLAEPLLDSPAPAQAARWGASFLARATGTSPNRLAAPTSPTPSAPPSPGSGPHSGGSGKLARAAAAAASDAEEADGSSWWDMSGWLGKAKRVLEDKKHQALQQFKESIHDVAAKHTKQILSNLGEYFKETAVSDPDMWPCVKPYVQSLVSNVWEDIEKEIEVGLRLAVVSPPAAQPSYEATWPDDAARAATLALSAVIRLRAFVLHHYLPYNRSIFGKLKDPVFVVLTCTTMLPVFGIRVFFFFWILMMLLFPGPPDEYQLINFVLTFKGTQFFTSGVGLGFVGAMEYYGCYLFADTDLRTCIDMHGPGSTDWISSLLVDYLGSIILVWIAFLFLPRSTRKCWVHKVKPRQEEVYCFCLKGDMEQGGRLRKILIYDVICFVFSFAVFIPVYLCAGERTVLKEASASRKFAHLKQTIFWCRILYSLFSLPFVLFVIPGVGKVLTHTVCTGYDANGKCLEFAFTETPGKPEQGRTG